MVEKIDIINKNMKPKDVFDILHSHGVFNTVITDLSVILMLLNYDYIEVSGYKNSCVLNGIRENDSTVEQIEI